MKKKTITTTSKIWIGKSYGPEVLLRDPLRMVNDLTFINPVGGDAQWESMGYVRVGDAEVTITLVDTDTLVQNKVESLRAEQTRVIADAQMRSTEIESKIQKLLAIECTAEAA